MASLYAIDKMAEENTMEALLQTDILEEAGCENITAVTDINLQKKGVDILADIDNKETKIDVKFIASDLNTFSQELRNVNSGKNGWISNNDLETDMYVYMYVTVDGAKNYNEGKKILAYDPSKITKIETIFVYKKDVQEFIEEHLLMKCNESESEKIVDCMLKISKRLDLDESIERYNIVPTEIGGRKIVYIEKEETKELDAWITYSPKIHERPVNVIIRKNALINMSIAHITRTFEAD